MMCQFAQIPVMSGKVLAEDIKISISIHEEGPAEDQRKTLSSGNVKNTVHTNSQ